MGNTRKANCCLCHSEIHAFARICPVCQRSQNWIVRNINFLIPVISLMIALVSVAVTGSDEINNMLFGKRPRLLVVLEEYSINRVKLTVLNEGSGSAVVSYIGCDVASDAQSEKYISFSYSASGSKIAAPGRADSFLFEFEWGRLGPRIFSEVEVIGDSPVSLIGAAYALGKSGGPDVKCKLWYDHGDRVTAERSWVFFSGDEFVSLASKFEQKFQANSSE